MRTDAKEYSEYLERKYLPGRRYYLRWLFYPKIFSNFPGSDTVVDLGCGTGEFLHYCRMRKRRVFGVDSNEALVLKNRAAGFDVALDDVCELHSLRNQQFRYAVCDNLLEHLEMSEIRRFFLRAAELLIGGGVLVCIVPGSKGFQMDPTHKTYVSQKLLKDTFESSCWAIKRHYHHPLNLSGIGKFLYLNMQVFEIKRL
jgi:SAM-dependent methyltransferase